MTLENGHTICSLHEIPTTKMLLNTLFQLRQPLSEKQLKDSSLASRSVVTLDYCLAANCSKCLEANGRWNRTITLARQNAFSSPQISTTGISFWFVGLNEESGTSHCCYHKIRVCERLTHPMPSELCKLKAAPSLMSPDLKIHSVMSAGNGMRSSSEHSLFMYKSIASEKYSLLFLERGANHGQLLAFELSRERKTPSHAKLAALGPV